MRWLKDRYASFGRRHLGKIQGAAQAITVLSSALGPIVFALCFERFKSYAPLLWIVAGMVALTALLMFTVKIPNRKSGS